MGTRICLNNFLATDIFSSRFLFNIQRGNEISNTKLLSGFLTTLQQIPSEAVATPRQRRSFFSCLLYISDVWQDHTKEHFKEEESDMLPRLEGVRRMQREEGKVSDKSNSAWASEALATMEVTHSKLFPFFMTGLLPQEAVQYLDLIFRCTKNTRHLVSMLRSLAERLEDANPSIIHNNPTKLYEHLLVKSP